MPPDALRPYFQEGYLSGTFDVATNYDNKTEVDFRNRLIAKFSIPAGDQFWGTGFQQIPKAALFPSNDAILRLCEEVKERLVHEGGNVRSEDVGKFLEKWINIEKSIIENARASSSKNLNFSGSLRYLSRISPIEPDTFKTLDELRKFRNKLIHSPNLINKKSFPKYMSLIDEIIKNQNFIYDYDRNFLL